MTDKEKTSSIIKRINESKDFKIVLPKDNELFLDINSEEEWKDFKNRLKIFKQHFGDGYRYMARASFSGLPHRHVTVTLPFKVNDAQRIALQAALGSSASREFMSLYKILNKDTRHPTLFIEKVEK